MKLSDADIRLLDALQQDATRSQVELAEIAGMSRTSVWRRIRDFEEAGLIERQVALVDPQAAGFSIHVLLAVAMTGEPNICSSRDSNSSYKPNDT